jgi:aminoglycoside phosphotransferase (APT) family kinase protein
MLNYLTDYLQANWEKLSMGRGRPEEFSLLLQSRHRANAFIFASGDSLPILVARFCRDANEAHNLRREFEVVSQIWASAPPPLRNTIPRPVAFLDGETPVALETFLPGKLMQVPPDMMAQQSIVDIHFAAAARWLFDLTHAFAGPDQAIDGAAARERIVACIARPVAHLEPTTAGKRYLERVVALADDLVGSPVLFTISHGDFIPGNILLASGRVVGVVDWEKVSRTEFPFYDWCRFLWLYCWEGARKATSRAATVEAVARGCAQLALKLGACPNHPLVRWTATFFAHYQLAERLIPLALLYTLSKDPDNLRVLPDVIEMMGTWLDEKVSILLPG